jgi:DNA-directed RNA polymerase specialized sigma24 family protein
MSNTYHHPRGSYFPDEYRIDLTDEELDPLVDRVIAGDAAAWQRLWLAVGPMIWAITSCFRLTSRLCESEDDRRNIVLSVMELLSADGFAELAAFRTQGEGSFRRWLGVVAGHRAVSCMRAHPDNDRGRWVRPGQLSEGLVAEHDDPIQAIDVRALLSLARKALTGDQLEALHVWLEEDDYDEIAKRLGLSGPKAAKTAERRIRAAQRRLRRRTGVEEKSSEPRQGSTGICALYGHEDAAAAKTPAGPNGSGSGVPPASA